jgi:predicted nucleic acid-binding protein
VVVELADTSAWTNRRKHSVVSADFEDRLVGGEIAICSMVKLELLWETRDARGFAERRARLEALDELPIDEPVWRRALDVFEQLANQGPLHHRQVKLPDLLVAAAAELHGVGVCHYDRDFDLIAEVTGQPVRAIAPIGSL